MRVLRSLVCLGLGGLVGLVGLVGAGCEESDLLGDTDGAGELDTTTDDPTDTTDAPPQVPGGSSWSSGDISCDDASDCAAGEACKEGVCQMERCVGGRYDSRAPMGRERAIVGDREIVVIEARYTSSDYWIDLYAPSGTSLAARPSVGLGGVPATAVAGGRFYGARPESFAIALTGRATVELRSMSADGRTITRSEQIALPFVPTALAAADSDGDLMDEIVAAGPNGKMALCNAVADTCEIVTGIGEGTTIDMDAGDVDGDGFAEVVLLQSGASKDKITVWQLDWQRNQQDEVATVEIDVEDGLAVAVGDVDGDQRADILVLENRGYLGLIKDAIHRYTAFSGPLVRRDSADTDGGAIDLAIGDSDADDRQEVYVLHEPGTLTDGAVESMIFDGGLRRSHLMPIPTTKDPRRLSFVDVDGDSPIGRLVDGPTLVSTQVLPTMVVTFPPYDREHSTGVSSVEVGEQTSTSERVSTTVGLNVGADIGFSADIGPIKAKLSTRVAQDWRTTNSTETTLSVGSRMSARAEPEVHGYSYGAVLLSVGCYHEYRYRMEDPAGKLGGDGGDFVLRVPVGGSTSMWSTTRYNAMAERLGDLPLVEVRSRIGDPSSYPNRPLTLDGRPIAAADLVFVDPPSFVVSDAVSVGFNFSTGERESREESATTSITVTASGQLAWFSAGVSGGGAWGTGLGVSVGTNTTFSGSVPQIIDDRSTPEDEYVLYAYRFTPFVYRHRYTDANGKPAAFYVVSYQVGN